MLVQERIFDPRGSGPRNKTERLDILSPRRPLDALKTGSLLFFNNTKLDFNTYVTVFKRLKDRFASVGVHTYIDKRQTVRGMTKRDLQQLAGELKASGAGGVIIGLADIGVTPASTILTCMLEEQGVPAVLLTAGPGTRLAEGFASHRAEALCLCPLDIYQASSLTDVEDAIDSGFPLILEYLTASDETLKELARLPEPPARPMPTADGFLEIDTRGNNAAGTNDLVTARTHPATQDKPSPARPQPAEKGLFEAHDGGEPREKSRRPEAVTYDQFSMFCERHRIGDGLPLVPPTESRVHAMLAFSPLPSQTVLVEEVGPAGGEITVHDIAVNAVSAGCRPEYLPVLVSAFQALTDPAYNFLQSVTTSHPGGNLVLVSGPIAQEIGVHGGQGCLGPGFHANATIGRAINLTIVNVSGAVPGLYDLDCLASQAEFSYCFAEDPSLTPWETINTERFDQHTSTVYVLKAEPPHDIIDFLSRSSTALLETIVGSCSTLGSNNAYIPGPLIVLLTPDHARLLADEGWIKGQIRDYIHLHARNPRSKVENRGIMAVRPKEMADMDPIPITRAPEDIEIVVAGGRGGHSAVILPWALHSDAIVRPILLPDGRVPSTIQDFRQK